MRFGAHEFTDTELVVMAVVNRTPDSFYDKGSAYRLDDAVSAVDSAVDNGAHIVDIGGIKAAPGPDIPPAEEIRRVTSLITAVRARHPGLVISADTWRAEVAEAAVLAGADMINDAWGGFDPGHDFNKNTLHSLEVTRRLGELTAGDWPVLVAVSNKDFIGESLDLPVTERLEGTLATLAICAWLGAKVFRVHNVKEARRALDMVSVISGTRPPRIARRATT